MDIQKCSSRTGRSNDSTPTKKCKKTERTEPTETYISNQHLVQSTGQSSYRTAVISHRRHKVPCRTPIRFQEEPQYSRLDASIRTTSINPRSPRIRTTRHLDRPTKGVRQRGQRDVVWTTRWNLDWPDDPGHPKERIQQGKKCFEDQRTQDWTLQHRERSKARVLIITSTLQPRTRQTGKSIREHEHRSQNRRRPHD